MLTLIWYPKCSTCQKARKWLDDMGLEYRLRDIKAQNPSAAELKAWQSMGGLPLAKFFNTSGLLYRSMELKNKLPAMSDEAIDDMLWFVQMYDLAAHQQEGQAISDKA